MLVLPNPLQVYARLCAIEILSSYIKEVTIGDVLTVRALIANPLDWQHFYEKLSAIRDGEKTEFTVVTAEGDRLVGEGDVAGFERWSDSGKYGFMIKVNVRKQKSLTDRRIRAVPKGMAAQAEKEAAVKTVPSTGPREAVTASEMSDFSSLLKASLAMDMSA